MAFINADLGNTPSEFQPLDPGEYELKVEEIEQKPSKKGDSEVLHIQFSVSAGPNEGRQIRDWISLKALTNLKRFALSCGLKEEEIASGFDPQDCVGAICKALVKNQIQTDDQTGEEITRSNISRYVIGE